MISRHAPTVLIAMPGRLPDAPLLGPSWHLRRQLKAFAPAVVAAVITDLQAEHGHHR